MLFNGIAIAPGRLDLQGGGGPDPGAPTAPSALTAIAQDGYQRILLSWTDNSADEDGFKIERSPDGSSGWTQIATVGANITQYEDYGLDPGTQYFYRVRAFNGSGNSAYTSNADDTTWIPTDLGAALKEWSKADADTYESNGGAASSDGNDVGYWHDQSGNGNHWEQTTADKKPHLDADAFGSIAGLVFDGVDDLLANVNAVFDSGTEGAVFIVAKLDLSTTPSGFIYGGTDEASSDHHLFLGVLAVGANSAMRISEKDGPSDNRVLGNSTYDDRLITITMYAGDGTDYRGRVDGSEQSLSVDAGSPSGDWFGDIADLDNTTIGARGRATEDNHMAMTVMEVVHVAPIPLAANITKIETYLAGRSGAFLPLLGTLSSATLDSPHDVATSADGNYAYVAGKGGSFVVVDISDPASPTITDSIGTYTEVQDVYVVDDTHVIIGDQTAIRTIDVSDPNNISEVSSVTGTGVNQPNGQAAWSDGTNTYLFYANKGGHITVIDITDPTNLAYQDGYDAATNESMTNPHDVVQWGNYIAIVNQWDGDTNKVQIYEVISGGSLLASGSWTARGTVTGSNLNGANRIFYQDNHLFVAANHALNVASIDVSNVASPSVASVVAATTTAGPSGLAPYKDNYMIAGSGKTVEVYDISTPSAIVKVDVESYGGVASADIGGLHDPAVFDGSYLVIIGQSDNKLGVIRIGAD